MRADGGRVRLSRIPTSYWEGSVATEGASGDKKIRGLGYVEMTGYAGQSMGRILQ